MNKPFHDETCPIVLMSTPRPTTSTNPFITLLSRSIEPDASIRFFTPVNVLFSSFDVFHLHWPEGLTRADGRVKTVLKTFLSLFLLVRIVVGRKPVVRTVHNLEPHEGVGKWERIVFTLFEQRESIRIYLNESTENSMEHGVVILHGNYEVSKQSQKIKSVDVNNSLITYGMLRPYKGLEKLIQITSEYQGKDLKLDILGKPISSQYGAVLAEKCSQSTNVNLEQRFVPDAELVQRIRNSDLVVLPYEGLYNSGAVILALSAGVPVLVPHTPSTLALQREVGLEWVNLFDKNLNKTEIDSAIRKSANIRTWSQPDLTRRSWANIGRMHVSVYKSIKSNSLMRSRKNSSWKNDLSHDLEIQNHSLNNRWDL